MPRARKHLVCVADTPYYHVSSRCVRRAFLCGVDRHTGQSFEHRRAWIEDRVRVLSSLFSIDICAYAVMSNHYHLVVKLNPVESDNWSDEEVLQRWTALYRGPLLVQRFRAGESLSAAEVDTVYAIAAVYRTRLASLSWFMKCLNEPIARQANAEDQCTGHFWEARFHSQALCSARALLAAMTYVDLNPIRAEQAETPEQSAYTSIRARLVGDDHGGAQSGWVVRMLSRGELHHFETPIRPLLGFSDSVEQTDGIQQASETLPIKEKDYLQLVDMTSRFVGHSKQGRIDPPVAAILDRLGLTPAQWALASTDFRQHYRNGHLRLKQTA